MNKSKKIGYYMSDEDLKALRKSIDYVKKLDLFNDNKKQESKVKKLKKAA